MSADKLAVVSIAWYVAAANLLTPQTSFFTLPVIDFR